MAPAAPTPYNLHPAPFEHMRAGSHAALLGRVPEIDPVYCSLFYIGMCTHVPEVGLEGGGWRVLPPTASTPTQDFRPRPPSPPPHRPACISGSLIVLRAAKAQTDR
jgi:hypothetical protein